MNTTEMKAAIQEDIETLKTIELDIMPSKLYYKRIRSIYRKVFCNMYAGTIFPWCLWALMHTYELKHNLVDSIFKGIEVWVIAIPGMLFLSLFLMGYINNYVIFDEQFRAKLKTGEMLDHLVKRIARISCWIYWGILMLAAFAFEPFYVAFLTIFVFVGLGFGVGGFVDMEIKRLGISVLFDGLKKHFEKKDAAEAQ